MTSNVEISWNGAFTLEEQAEIRSQLSHMLLGEEVHICACGRLTVAVFGDWLQRVFDGFIYCDCGQQLYTRVRGQLPRRPAS